MFSSQESGTILAPGTRKSLTGTLEAAAEHLARRLFLGKLMGRTFPPVYSIVGLGTHCDVPSLGSLRPRLVE